MFLYTILGTFIIIVRQSELGLCGYCLYKENERPLTEVQNEQRKIKEVDNSLVDRRYEEIRQEISQSNKELKDDNKLSD